MYFYLILALQGYCVYHCYTNRNQYYWILAIIFLPVIGSLIYLFMNVIQKQDIDKVQQGLTAVINPSKKIIDLEKSFRFAATFENQVALADAYLEAEHFEKAIENYEASLKDVFKEDFYVISRLQEAHYFSSEFDKAKEYAERIKDHQKFEKSRASFLYALTLEKEGSVEAAETRLKTFDAPYARYQERLELAKFFIRNTKTTEARDLLYEIVTESEGMSKTSHRQNRVLIKKAKDLLASGF
ncbi:hypothetical protein FEE95_15675 [Maribacter algarum]|uniref:Cardiolipin synthase N-terminal domain-containing protein n=2 Tax=Maribacter algarum (ex Zhang et al. 2020) TaxID=2578118 RepID=A0A5S3PNL8_9FLAO|nr:hypothetical protein FEE95_15675 [Maribacter algarum]